jgi:type IV secretory pathway TrbD component
MEISLTTTQLTALLLGLGGWVAGAILLVIFWFLCKWIDKEIVQHDPSDWRKE